MSQPPEHDLPARAPVGRRASQAARSARGRVAPPAPNDLRRRVQRSSLSEHGDAPQASTPSPSRDRRVATAPARSSRPGPSAARAHSRPTRNGQSRLVVVDDALVRAKRDRVRVGFMSLLVIALLCGLAGRLLYVQVAQGDRWRDEATKQSSRRTETPAARGTISDRNGNVLAADVPSDRVVVNPQEVDNPQYYAHVLTTVLGIDETRLAELMQPEKTKSGVMVQYRVLANSVDANTAEVLKDMDFPGITVEPVARRDYPSGTLAAPVMGAVQPDELGSVGSAGIEFMMERTLNGRPGLVIADRDVNGLAIPRSEQRNSLPVPGDDVTLTLDSGIQYQAEQILLDQVLAQDARGGNVTVLDVANGDVLAMASVTGGHSTKGAHVSTAREANQPLVMGYEPGSVMKIVTITSAIEEGCITPQSVFQVPMTMRNGAFTLTDDESHGVMSWKPIDILTHSSNVGTAMIARQCATTSEEFDRWLKRFRFGSLTGLKFPGEAPGALVAPEHYGDSGVASNAVGYGAVASPMQILDAYAALARGGKQITPRFVRSTTSHDGKTREVPVKEGATVASPQTAAAVRVMFKNVVTEGTGVCAAVPGFDVAGKTGTVRKRDAARGSHFASFVGFAPAQNPRIAVMVVLDDPNETYGGKAAAPVFSEVMSVALARMQVAPLDPTPGIPTQFEIAHGHARRSNKSCSVPHGDTLRSILDARAHPKPAPTTTVAKKPTTSSVSNARSATTASPTTRTTASVRSTSSSAP